MKKLKTTKTEETCCPQCGMKISAATSTEGNHKPTPGDLSVCLYCATPFSELRQIRAAQTVVRTYQRRQ